MPIGYVILIILVVVVLLTLLAGWLFDRARRREGLGEYTPPGNKQQYVDIPVAGEMVPKPPERPVYHSSALDAEEDAEADSADDDDRPAS